MIREEWDTDPGNPEWQRRQLIVALRSMLRCPGIGTTDQETGETFDSIACDALRAAGVTP